MKITIDCNLASGAGITLEELSVLFYYLMSGTGILNNVICNTLWEKNFLIKVEDGYIINNNKLSEIESWIDTDHTKVSIDVKYERLAEKMRELYPKGLKPGTTYCWRDSIPIIAKKLKTVVEKFNTQFTEEQALDATRRYVESFNGDYRFMQLLKYFILKTDKATGDIRSDFLSLLQNPDAEDSLNDNWLNEVR